MHLLNLYQGQYDDFSITNLVCSNSIDKLNDLKCDIEKYGKIYLEISVAEDFPKQSELDQAYEKYDGTDSEIDLIEILENEKCEWKFSKQKELIPENLLQYLIYLDDDTFTLDIKEIGEI